MSLEVLRVGPYDIDIHFVPLERLFSEAAGGVGKFDPLLLQICIGADLDPVMQVDALLHELGHAIYFASSLEGTDGEERTVSTMATSWTQIYRDNPELLAWIDERLNPPCDCELCSDPAPIDLDTGLLAEFLARRDAEERARHVTYMARIA